MNVDGLALLAGVAVLVFWAVGAWNRLMTLRNGVAAAWLQVADALRQRDEAAAPLFDALRDPLASEASALAALAEAHRQSLAAALAMGQRPLAAERAAAWVAAQTALGPAAARVFALLEGAAPGRREPALARLVAAWHEGEQRAGFARQLFNREAAAYDEARSQFPTSLLVRLYGFGPAGRV